MWPVMALPQAYAEKVSTVSDLVILACGEPRAASRLLSWVSRSEMSDLALDLDLPRLTTQDPDTNKPQQPRGLLDQQKMEKGCHDTTDSCTASEDMDDSPTHPNPNMASTEQMDRNDAHANSVRGLLLINAQVFSSHANYLGQERNQINEDANMAHAVETDRNDEDASPVSDLVSPNARDAELHANDLEQELNAIDQDTNIASAAETGTTDESASLVSNIVSPNARDTVLDANDLV